MVDKNDKGKPAKPETQAAAVEREIANAVEAPATQTAAEPEQTGTLHDVYDFDRIVFKMPTSDREFVRESDGQKSKAAANFWIPFIMAPNQGTPGTIYARLKKNAKVPVLDATFAGSRTSSALEPADDAGKEELVSVRAQIAKLYVAWRSKQPKTAVATRPGQVEAPADLGITFDS